ncbi:hypothetical protein GCM10017771_97280 [Streptomyces capitiformicae]|uniref:Uncharacterized protein n=1 Tax=Streptomyces capitiformicae TaxID=2014920 RepID=A0A919DRW0_9ACTN|nr:hypothetical protein GCM10017771_97280 [Streptomyces capitiformicae]
MGEFCPVSHQGRCSCDLFAALSLADRPANILCLVVRAAAIAQCRLRRRHRRTLVDGFGWYGISVHGTGRSPYVVIVRLSTPPAAGQGAGGHGVERGRPPDARARYM